MRKINLIFALIVLFCSSSALGATEYSSSSSDSSTSSFDYFDIVGPWSDPCGTARGDTEITIPTDLHLNTYDLEEGRLFFRFQVEPLDTLITKIKEQLLNFCIDKADVIECDLNEDCLCPFDCYSDSPAYWLRTDLTGMRSLNDPNWLEVAQKYAELCQLIQYSWFSIDANSITPEIRELMETIEAFEIGQDDTQEHLDKRGELSEQLRRFLPNEGNIVLNHEYRCKCHCNFI
jgi:hypothetical protein